MMSFKIPCGGFKLDEKSFSLDVNGVLSVSGGGGGGGVTTLHINVTALNAETMEATFTADKTPAEMKQASANGPVWCVVTFAAGVVSEDVLSVGVPPAWYGSLSAFGYSTNLVHNENGNNTFSYVVREATPDRWSFDITQFGG